jgi:protein SCO1
MAINKGVANTIIGLVAFMALLIGLMVNRVLSPTVLNHEQLSEQGLFIYDTPRRFNDFSLTDHNNKPLTKALLNDRWTLVFFGYTSCPDVCPTTMATIHKFDEFLAEKDKKAADKLQVLFVSVDPMRDTPEKLNAYVKYFGEDYVGATGEYIEIFNLAHQLNIAFGYLPGKEGAYDVTHSGEIALINPAGDFQGFFKSPPDPQKMLMTFRSVLAEWPH